jgi:hypothetical protein
MELIIFWVIMGGVVAMIAGSKGHSAGLWFIYGALIWPIALVHILVTPAAVGHQERVALQSGNKKCPRCAEIVKSEARVCRFCSHEFVS